MMQDMTLLSDMQSLETKKPLRGQGMTGRLPGTVNSPQPLDYGDNRLREACSRFESLFTYYLFKEMRETVPECDLLGGGRAEEMYTSMLDRRRAEVLSEGRGIGLASMLYEQLTGIHGGEGKVSPGNPQKQGDNC